MPELLTMPQAAVRLRAEHGVTAEVWLVRDTSDLLFGRRMLRLGQVRGLDASLLPQLAAAIRRHQEANKGRKPRKRKVVA
jgi:hypothetical protein